MQLVRDNAIQSSTMKEHGEIINPLNLLTKENNKQISDIDSKYLGVAEENQNIINNKRDKLKLLLKIGDSMVRFTDAKNSQTS